ncbi:MAG: amidase [Chloroflexota bacterium]
MDELTIKDLQAMQAAGEAGARDLVDRYLERIQRLDREGPRLNSVIELNPDAGAIADALDSERRAGHVRGPLHGIPLLIKDNIDTADRMTTTAGSLALEGHIAAQDAFLVERLRQAGVVLLGKTNLSEWANFRSTHSSSGWSSRGGQTRNPYALDRTPCGSSSGSGAAVAASLCAAAVGTETDGSIVCPAHTCGIVGLKPTLGLISRAGVIPIAHSQDTAGPMARTVTDAALLLGALTGVDARDPATAASEGKFLTDYTPFLDPDGLRGARIGVARSYFGFDARVDAIMELALQALREAGAELIDPVKVVEERRLGRAESAVLHYEFKADLDAYLGSLGPEAPVHSMQDVIRFNETHKQRVMPYFGQERMLAAVKRGSLRSKGYLRALETCRKLAGEGLMQVIEAQRLDAIVAPTGGPAWLIDLVNGDQYTGGGFSSPAAVAGFPHITVPAGFIWGLPIGLSFFGAPWSEGGLLRLAYAYEQATRQRRPPRYLPTAEL